MVMDYVGAHAVGTPLTTIGRWGESPYGGKITTAVGWAHDECCQERAGGTQTDHNPPQPAQAPAYIHVIHVVHVGCTLLVG